MPDLDLKLSDDDYMIHGFLFKGYKMDYWKGFKVHISFVQKRLHAKISPLENPTSYTAIYTLRCFSL